MSWITAVLSVSILSVGFAVFPLASAGGDEGAELAVAQANAMAVFLAGEIASSTPSLSAQVADFFRDRALDLCDLFRFRLNIPRGYRAVGFKARGTCLVQAGFVYFDGRSAGIDRRGVGVWRERRLEGGVGPFYFSDVADEMISGNRFTDRRSPWSLLYRRGIVRNGLFWDDGRRHPLSCGAEIELGLFGIEFETYPLEYLDALLGWVGLDSPNDDEGRILKQWKELQTIPELRVRDEWSESLETEAKEAAGGGAVAPAPAEESQPEPLEQPLVGPETAPDRAER